MLFCNYLLNCRPNSKTLKSVSTIQHADCFENVSTQNISELKLHYLKTLLLWAVCSKKPFDVEQWKSEQCLMKLKGGKKRINNSTLILLDGSWKVSQNTFDFYRRVRDRCYCGHFFVLFFVCYYHPLRTNPLRS